MNKKDGFGKLQTPLLCLDRCTCYVLWCVPSSAYLGNDVSHVKLPCPKNGSCFFFLLCVRNM